jgi:hypothetical protein
MARRLEDDRSLCEVLFTPFLVPAALSGTQSADLRNRLSEALAIAERLNDADLRTRFLSVHIYYSAEFGDYQGMIAALDQFQSSIEGRQMLHQEWVGQLGRAMQALLIGDFAAAEKLAENAYAMGRRTHGESVEGVYGMQMFTIRREQGRLAEIAPVIKQLINNGPEGNTWKPGFALVATELGFKPQAQKMLDELRQTDFAFPMDAKRSTTLSYLADVCAALEDERCARALYDLLEPYRHMTVTAGIVTSATDRPAASSELSPTCSATGIVPKSTSRRRYGWTGGLGWRTRRTDTRTCCAAAAAMATAHMPMRC